MRIYMISFTENGGILNDRIKNVLDDCEIRLFYKKDVKESLKEWTESAFADGDALIFTGAAGIAVRSIAPFIKRKDIDPAVIVCDEKGRFVIPVLSGHIGGANVLAKRIAEKIGAVPVITTATDLNGVWAVDNWAAENGFKINNIENIKYISAKMLKGERIGLISDIIINERLPENIYEGNTETECGIVISPFIKKVYDKTLNIVPKCLFIGVGSRKNAYENALVNLYKEIQAANSIDSYAVKAVATINIKKNEKSVLNLREYLNTDLICYSAEQLNSAGGQFEGSDFVKYITGTDNVCERSAVMASGGEIAIHKTKGNGVTLAASVKRG